MKFKSSLMVGWILTIISVTAYAATVSTVVDTQLWWQNLLVTVITAVVAIVTPILSVLVMVLVKKWKISLEQKQVDWVLDKSLGFGEQKLKTLLKDGKPMDGSGAKETAVLEGGKLLKQYGLAKKFGDWLASGIEARLGQQVLADGGAVKVVNGAATAPDSTATPPQPSDSSSG